MSQNYWFALILRATDTIIKIIPLFSRKEWVQCTLYWVVYSVYHLLFWFLSRLISILVRPNILLTNDFPADSEKIRLSVKIMIKITNNFWHRCVRPMLWWFWCGICTTHLSHRIQLCYYLSPQKSKTYKIVLKMSPSGSAAMICQSIIKQYLGSAMLDLTQTLLSIKYWEIVSITD